MREIISIFALCILLAFADADIAKYRKFIKQQARNKTFVKLFDEHVYRWNKHRTKLHGVSFPCSVPPTTKATTSVHTLTPNDVKVIAAMGDSITAGTGITAKTVIGLLTQNRGYSFSIGGVGDYEDFLTVANVIKKFEPDVKGFSTGNGNENSRHAHLDVAKVGAKSSAMPGQADKLIDKMKKEPGVDFENDWKLITLFVGGNDLCDYCDNKEELSPANYVANIKQALDILIANVPRAFVNLVPVLNITVVSELNQNLICSTIHLALCRCAAYPINSEAHKELEQVMIDYQSGVQQLVESGRYDTRDDFTVVVQPFFSETPLPRNPDGSPDLGYFAPDCFHLSQKGHEAAAVALWNNMFEPVGLKRLKWQPGEPTECPSEEKEYFFTYKNSPSYYLSNGNNVGNDFEECVPKKNSDDTSTSSTSSTILIIGLCVGVLVVCLVSVIVYRKISSTAPKKNRMSYTEIQHHKKNDIQ